MRLPLSDRVPVGGAAAVVFWAATSRSSESLKEGRHGGHDLDRGRVDVVDAAKGLLSEINKQTNTR